MQARVASGARYILAVNRIDRAKRPRGLLGRQSSGQQWALVLGLGLHPDEKAAAIFISHAHYKTKLRLGLVCARDRSHGKGRGGWSKGTRNTQACERVSVWKNCLWGGRGWGEWELA